MAEQNRPLFSLSPEMRERFEKFGKDEERVKRQIAALKEIGIDTAPLEEKLEWASRVRQTILKADEDSG